MISLKRQRAKYVLADLISTNVALLLFNFIRYSDLPSAQSGFSSLTSFMTAPTVMATQLLFPLFMLGLYYLSGYYHTVYTKSRVSEFSITLVTALIGTLVMFFAFLINDLTLDRTRDYSLFLILLSLMFTVVYIPRLLITSSTARKIRSGKIYFDTLIVGYSSRPQLFVRQLEKITNQPAVRPVGLIDFENRARICVTGLDLPISDASDIPRIADELNISRIVVIPHPDGWEHTSTVITSLFRLQKPIYIAAGDIPPYIVKPRLSSLTAEPLIDISSTDLPESTMTIKRTADVVISSLGLILSALPIAACALAIKATSKGPAFYRQIRVGRLGRQFNIYKLRTMRADAEADGTPRLSSAADGRITPLGHVLRKYRIDELPQLFNVLRGDMSIVGPRPERPYFIEQLIEREPGYLLCQRVRPGLTSLGMVKYGYASNIDQMVERVRFDLLYLDNISFVTDTKIIFHTARTVFSGRGV